MQPLGPGDGEIHSLDRADPETARERASQVAEPVAGSRELAGSLPNEVGVLVGDEPAEVDLSPVITPL